MCVHVTNPHESSAFRWFKVPHGRFSQNSDRIAVSWLFAIRITGDHVNDTHYHVVITLYQVRIKELAEEPLAIGTPTMASHIATILFGLLIAVSTPTSAFILQEFCDCKSTVDVLEVSCSNLNALMGSVTRKVEDIESCGKDDATEFYKASIFVLERDLAALRKQPLPHPVAFYPSCLFTDYLFGSIEGIAKTIYNFAKIAFSCDCCIPVAAEQSLISAIATMKALLKKHSKS
ncbi:hypothetical protein L596_015497 [Steinernema carpocapsae]|uniref:Uncharacterized protein n=1 Tax=Steinernema carpocapsae TaxID=34508 RepID=A0A4U5NG20_STECR|nr:hypothetical protein L596_015497 [Steinernema carpocapsae]